MNIRLFAGAIIILFNMSCRSPQKGSTDKETEDLINDMRGREMADSFIKAMTKSRYKDSTGMETSPVLVTSATFTQREYSNYRNIRLRYKNISDKDIEAIRFEWYAENAFGEPADVGVSIEKGAGGGFTEEKLRAGQSSSGEWDILSRDGKKIIMARAYEVAFSDGSKWELRRR